jgi:hypothetical protein
MDFSAKGRKKREEEKRMLRWNGAREGWAVCLLLRMCGRLGARGVGMSR